MVYWSLVPYETWYYPRKFSEIWERIMVKTVLMHGLVRLINDKKVIVEVTWSFLGYIEAILRQVYKISGLYKVWDSFNER